jgi:hypothetical protein
MAIVSELKRLRFGSANCDRVTELKRKLRFLQRRSIFDRERDGYQKIGKLMKEDRHTFWKKVSAIKRMTKKRATVTTSRPTANDFVEFFSKQFSHCDIPTNEEHKGIEEAVSFFKDSISANLQVNPFSYRDIEESIMSLKCGKSAGIDGLSNEFYKFGHTTALVCILKIFFNSILESGYIPSGFNTSLLIPVPKKKELSKPSDYRPISVSTGMSTLFESLIFKRMHWIEDLSLNQFGYKAKTSCKSAYFVANETMQFYRGGGSGLHVVSLDAAKAFDKLWRNGLFYKLIDRVDKAIWRILFNYYNDSHIMICADGLKSESFKTYEGLKQGGIISPFLFNFFINELLVEATNMEIGAKVGTFNVSIIAYCDDLLLMSSNENHMNKLLECCHRYAINWKMEFNASKSISYSIKQTNFIDFKLGDSVIPKSDGFIYLGLPIGDDIFVEKFFLEKFRKCEKSLYSLRALGCKPNGLSPYSTSFIYKTFCQSIIKFGLENLYL